MLPRRYKWPKTSAPPVALVPPDLKVIGAITFTPEDHAHLHGWLKEDGWPKARMNIDMLEGYLVAMIIWPVELSPGAWLPAIWGIRGWKVADKISAPDVYQRFSRLVVGYRQHLASIVNTKPRTYAPEFCSTLLGSADSDAAMHWSMGFLSALQGGAQGFNWRSAEVTAAVQVIAGHAQPKSHTVDHLPTIAAELGAAVLAIVLDRSMGRDSSAPKVRHHAPLH